MSQAVQIDTTETFVFLVDETAMQNIFQPELPFTRTYRLYRQHAPHCENQIRHLLKLATRCFEPGKSPMGLKGE